MTQTYMYLSLIHIFKINFFLVLSEWSVIAIPPFIQNSTSAPAGQWKDKHKRKKIEIRLAKEYTVSYKNNNRERVDTMGNESYAIMTEVTCDLPAEYLQKNDVIAIPMNYTLDGDCLLYTSRCV